MREIKFRAWDDDQKQMLYGEDFYSLVVCFDKGFNYLLNKSKFKVMQFTGLYDKNGKEIYEGDIVDNIIVWGDTYEKSQVVFQDGCFSLNLSDKRGHKYEPCLYEADDRIKVIGNIYENPELIEEKK